MSAKAFTKPGFFELRTDQVLPGSLNAYMDEHIATAPERHKLLPGWLLHAKTEIGGSVNQVVHLYHWNDYDQRDRAR